MARARAHSAPPSATAPPPGPSFVAQAFLLVLAVYRRLISPALPAACRFVPSCSAYAVSCVEAHGALRGGLLSLVRLCKCHPFHPGGYDPPPLPPAEVSGSPPAAAPKLLGLDDF